MNRLAPNYPVWYFKWEEEKTKCKRNTQTAHRGKRLTSDSLHRVRHRKVDVPVLFFFSFFFFSFCSDQTCHFSSLTAIIPPARSRRSSVSLPPPPPPPPPSTSRTCAGLRAHAGATD
ncbi:hypothetical protein F2P81_021167 [Scophthalmus maximus]|uniref:Uncharacterized protein n=1 Tax=Scophthalmus maximus TaxID=52904 RepID=A0A6A4S471_SCOMX|nr:hypothetical protein F2P81_021167 [Scophthalmus maximus]